MLPIRVNAPTKRRGRTAIAVLALATALSAVAPAAAHGRVVIGGVVGVPWVYPYPPPYYYYPYPYPYPSPPPPGWEPGHWEWRYDAGGRRYRVWVPPHLR